MKLASVGLTAQEQDLLVQQLKLLAGRLTAPWIYVGEGADADLVLIRGSRLDAPTYRGLAAYPGAAQSKKGDLNIEWPLRMVALREVLLEAERRLMVEASGPSSCEQLAELKMGGWLEVDGKRMIFFPRNDRVEADVADRDELVALLTRPDFNLQAQLQLDVPANLPEDGLACKVSLRGLVWSLALRSGAHCERNWDRTGLLFRLGAWPHFDEWEVSPPLLRLAALYSRKAATIADGAQMSGLDEVEVRGFLYACELCQVGVSKEYVEQRPEPAQPVAPPPSNGMLQRLRDRLGLSFGRKG